jgi:hypothetical protein
MLHRTPASDIPCALVPRLTASLLTAGLRRSAQPIRRFASARSDTSPQNGIRLGTKCLQV